MSRLRVQCMTTVVYEKKIDKAISHVTRDGEATICKKKCTTWPFAVTKETPTVCCSKCWPNFS